MKRKTEGVYLLVEDVLRTFSEPYGEDIIEDVCLSIERNPEWHRRYNELCQELEYRVVNSAIGRYTKTITGLQSVIEVDAKRSTLITAYTKLVQKS